jgi:hypothetical protein
MEDFLIMLKAADAGYLDLVGGEAYAEGDGDAEDQRGCERVLGILFRLRAAGVPGSEADLRVRFLGELQAENLSTTVRTWAKALVDGTDRVYWNTYHPKVFRSDSPRLVERQRYIERAVRTHHLRGT